MEILNAAEPKQTCVIVGASHTGVSLALQLRKEGWQGPIKLIGAESELPYHRPPLSKEFLAGSKALDAMRLRPEKMYLDNNIELLLGNTVATINAAEKSLQLTDGQTLSYDKLALCTGASVMTLPSQPVRDNVSSIRTAADVIQLKERLKTAGRAVIIGGGYIGLETAAVLTAAGWQVTVIEREDRILARVTSSIVADYLQAVHESHGVKIVTNATVSALAGDETVNSVQLNDGSELVADLVLVGIGVMANEQLASAAGLEVDRGIVVDACMRTSDSDIFAAGDCTRHPHKLYPEAGLIRLESVQNANDQGRTAAANIAGRELEYDAIPWFWSDQYDLKLQMSGLNSDYDETISRGSADPAEGDGFAVFYLKNDKVVAADCIAQPRVFMASKQFIQGGFILDAASKTQLADPDADLTQLLKSLQ
ncbi:MAG: FAD-dependent oxidoreductase [Gammaproteobacteria bacterium]